VLREVIVLETNGGYITVRQRDARTQRTYYQLNAAGERLVEEVIL
jgi:DNA-binding PadR family transcriptional regulator